MVAEIRLTLPVKYNAMSFDRDQKEIKYHQAVRIFLVFVVVVLLYFLHGSCIIHVICVCLLIVMANILGFVF